MTSREQEQSLGGASLSEAEVTLRLIASLPAPQGLEERIQAGLRAAPKAARVLAWPRAASSGWLRGAAAAAIVLVVAGGGWGIYARVQPGAAMQPVAGPRLAGPGTFSGANAARRPVTLQGPAVPPAVVSPPVKVEAPAAATGAVKPKVAAGSKAVVPKPAATSIAPLRQ